MAGRYATALFEIVRDGGDLRLLEGDLEAVGNAIADSSDLRDLISSPIFSRDEMVRAIGAIAERMGLNDVLAKTLGLMAQKRRLFVLPELLTQVRALIADQRGEVTADVKSASPLSPEQAEALTAMLRSTIGTDVKLNVQVDGNLISGLVVKVGSTMIDTSLSSKLANLKNVMKEVG